MKRIFSLLLSLVLILAVSCEKSIEPTPSEDAEVPLEDRLIITYDESTTESEVTSYRNTIHRSLFEGLLTEMGYHIWTEDAAHYKAFDPATGKTGHMTLIPCSVPGDNSRIAIIKYLHGQDVYAVTAAQYFQEEDYEIAHPVDETGFLSMLGDDGDPNLKIDILERSERSNRYWQCVAKRFIAGCSGCATVCYLTGPAWGPCTAKCCAGSAVVALVTCAFTVYLGW
jgi:hypothetical protein